MTQIFANMWFIPPEGTFADISVYILSIVLTELKTEVSYYLDIYIWVLLILFY